MNNQVREFAEEGIGPPLDTAPLCQCRYQILAHTGESQRVSSEGVKINTPTRGTSSSAVELILTGIEWQRITSKQYFPLRSHVPTNTVGMWSIQHKPPISAEHNE